MQFMKFNNKSNLNIRSCVMEKVKWLCAVQNMSDKKPGMKNQTAGGSDIKKQKTRQKQKQKKNFLESYVARILCNYKF